MDEYIPKERHGRDYVIKFPEDLLVDNLRNHMLFAAEVSPMENNSWVGELLLPLASNQSYGSDCA